MLKIAIAVASNDMIYTDTAMSLISMLTYSLYKVKNVHPFVINKKSAITDLNHCDLVHIAKENKADKILFFDPDQTFPANSLEKLLSHKKDYVSTYCTQRQAPFKTTAMHLDGKVRLTPLNAEGLIEVKWIGNPLSLISMSVLDKIDYPYFRVTLDMEKREWQGCDLWLCKRMREEGIKIWCDTELSKEIGHIGCYPFKLGDFYK